MLLSFNGAIKACSPYFKLSVVNSAVNVIASKEITNEMKCGEKLPTCCGFQLTLLLCYSM